MPRPTLFTHPKFQRLVRLLEMPEPHVLGHLEYLWRVGYESGNPLIGDGVDVELAAKWAGAQGQLVEALDAVGFIDRSDANAENAASRSARYAIHHLHENAPDYVRLRSLRHAERSRSKQCEVCGTAYRNADDKSRFCSTACRSKAYRDRHAASRHASRDVTQRHSTTAPAPAPAPTPAPTPCVHTEARPEPATFDDWLEPDEEPEPEPAPDPAAVTLEPPEPPEPPGPSSVRRDTSPIILTFPTKDGPWALRQAQLASWSSTYAAVDVLDECRKALAWTQANPGKRKRTRGMPAFLVGWLNRAVDTPAPPTAYGTTARTAGNLEALQRFASRGRP